MQPPVALRSALNCHRRNVCSRAAAVGLSLHEQRRAFGSRLIDAFGDRVSQSVDAFARTAAVFQDERMVTESRRKLERFQTAPETLAERLAGQRSVRRFVVPSDIRVDKSKQYIEFTWPREAVEAAMRAEREAAAKSAEDVQGSQTAAVADAIAEGDGSASSSSTATPPPWLRTRGLAEYLRAYTPSTDGKYGMPRHPIYGRRGITITDVYPIGNYALRIIFSDGHTGGIYSYEYLFFLTSPATKYGLMRDYVRDLREKKKSRDPPRRAPSRRRVPQKVASAAVQEDDLGVGRKSESDDGGEGSHLAPAFPPSPAP